MRLSGFQVADAFIHAGNLAMHGAQFGEQRSHRTVEPQHHRREHGHVIAQARIVHEQSLVLAREKIEINVSHAPIYKALLTNSQGVPGIGYVET
jgi:hypothetical protein